MSQQLCPPPAGFQHFAWFGMSFFLPSDWNLYSFRGDARHGALIFADMRQLQLHIRWKRPGPLSRSPAKLVESTIAKLKARFQAARSSKVSDRVFRVKILPTETIILTSDTQRMYELAWPHTPPAPTDPVITSFLSHLQNPSATTHWEWDVYGARGTVPAIASLKEISLPVGAPCLTFTSRGKAWSFGALSLADQLLAAATLREVGEKHLVLAPLKGAWTQQEQAHRFEGEIRHPLIPRSKVPFAFAFSHDPSANQIRWNLATATPFLKTWRPGKPK